MIENRELNTKNKYCTTFLEKISKIISDNIENKIKQNNQNNNIIRECLEDVADGNPIKKKTSTILQEILTQHLSQDILIILKNMADASKGSTRAALNHYMLYEIDKQLNSKDIDFKNYMKKLQSTTVEQYLNGLDLINNYLTLFEKDKMTYLEKHEKTFNFKSPNNTIQKIYYGAPGTGKSYAVSKLIKEYYDLDDKENPYVFRTTIYQDYSYYDFIGNIMPKNEEGKITYEFKPGPFTLALEKALNNPEYPVFLVVEEMSRGNIASIFGDIFQLLDRKDGISDYSITNIEISKYINRDKIISENELQTLKIYLPKNLHIIGTVNTSDQNVNVMDTAFKRRFSFEYVNVDPIKDSDGNYINNFEFELGGKEFNWISLYTTLNKFIVEILGLNEDKQIGQFFIKFGNNKEENKKEIRDKLLQYLWDDVQNFRISNDYSIFNSDENTFGKLYKDFTENKNIFSDSFMKKYEGN